MVEMILHAINSNDKWMLLISYIFLLLHTIYRKLLVVTNVIVSLLFYFLFV